MERGEVTRGEGRESRREKVYVEKESVKEKKEKKHAEKDQNEPIA